MRSALFPVALSMLLAPACHPGVQPLTPPKQTPASPAAHLWALIDVRLPGGRAVELVIDRDRIAQVLEPGAADPQLTRVDASGAYLAPAFIDSHVHLAYLPAARALLDGGVAAAVDLAAPESMMRADHGALSVVRAGPMLTAPLGYPTQSWGRADHTHEGFGTAVHSEDEARATVSRLADRGAGLIKLPLGHAPQLPDATMSAAIEAAHSRSMKVAVHALDPVSAAHAANLGADLLAHTPVLDLPPPVIGLWSSRAVISTLAAFGGTQSAIDNLRKLREAGAQILYGTDLGNTRETKINLREIELLAEAGLDGRAIVEAGTRAPADYFGLEGLGRIAQGYRASFLLLDADPWRSPNTLTRPRAVYINGLVR